MDEPAEEEGPRADSIKGSSEIVEIKYRKYDISLDIYIYTSVVWTSPKFSTSSCQH